jgi:hypothetical protein
MLPYYSIQVMFLWKRCNRSDAILIQSYEKYVVLTSCITDSVYVANLIKVMSPRLFHSVVFWPLLSTSTMEDVL